MRQLVIHLVDDNDIDIAVNTKLLQLAEIGGEVVVYSSGTEFLTKIQADPARWMAQKNVVLLDIMMPGLTGFQCMDQFNELDSTLTDKFYVFMLSSTIDRNDIKRAENTPRVHRVLEKPLDVYQLKKSIEQIVL